MELVHEYVLPEIATAPMDIGLPAHMAVFDTTEAVGNGLTVIVTEFDFTQAFEFVSVKVYELVEVGETEGFETVELYPEIELTQE